jgi:hypothetical protein
MREIENIVLRVLASEFLITMVEMVENESLRAQYEGTKRSHALKASTQLVAFHGTSSKRVQGYICPKSVH